MSYTYVRRASEQFDKQFLMCPCPSIFTDSNDRRCCCLMIALFVRCWGGPRTIMDSNRRCLLMHLNLNMIYGLVGDQSVRENDNRFLIHTRRTYKSFVKYSNVLLRQTNTSATSISTIHCIHPNHKTAFSARIFQTGKLRCVENAFSEVTTHALAMRLFSAHIALNIRPNRKFH